MIPSASRYALVQNVASTFNSTIRKDHKTRLEGPYGASAHNMLGTGNKISNLMKF